MLVASSESSAIATAAPTLAAAGEPRWLRAVAFASATLVAALGAAGLLLADIGIYRLWAALALGLVGWLGLLALGRPLLVAPGGASRTATVVAALAVVFVICISAWHIANTSQHVLIDRDPGAYVNGGRWIASHGNLTVNARVFPFAHEPTLTFASPAVYDRTGDKLTFQFAHLLPAVLAEAHGIGGDSLMFAMSGLLSGVALLAFFVVAWRFIGNPYGALGAVVAFAFLLPQVVFSRDMYSELPTQVLLFTALWILLDRANLFRPRVVLLAALLLGLIQAARIDALALLFGLPLVFAFTYLSVRSPPRGAVTRSAVACVAGLAPGMALGFADLMVRSPQYVADLSSNVKSLIAAALASVVISILLVLSVSSLRRHWAGRAAWSRMHIPEIVAGLVIAAGFGAWLVRPHVQRVRATASQWVAILQQAGNIAVDPTRAYYEHSMQWMSWYLGPAALAAAILGAALLVRSLLRGEHLGVLPLVALLGPASALYLWNASITPDHVWAMRRFAVSALPMFVVLAFWFIVALARSASRLRGAAGVAVSCLVILLATLTIGAPVHSVLHLRRVTEQRGYVAVVRDACATIGRNAAVVVLRSENDPTYLTVPQTLRTWCGVPAAILRGSVTDQAAALHRLGRKADGTNQRLWVVAGDPRTIVSVLPDTVPQSTRVVTNPYKLELTLVRRPTQYANQSFMLALAKVPSD